MESAKPSIRVDSRILGFGLERDAQLWGQCARPHDGIPPIVYPRCLPECDVLFLILISHFSRRITIDKQLLRSGFFEAVENARKHRVSKLNEPTILDFENCAFIRG